MTDFLNDSNGNNSSTRLVMFMWSIAVMLVWIAVCFYKREMIDIPVGVGGVLLITLGGKVAQSVFGEKGKKDEPDAN